MRETRDSSAGVQALSAEDVSVEVCGGGTRGLVRIDGALDERLAPAGTGAIMRLLEQDVGEVWIDVRHVTRVAPLALAALLSWRRRAVRVGARLVLVAEDGPVLQLLAAAGVRDSFAVVARPPNVVAVAPTASVPLASVGSRPRPARTTFGRSRVAILNGDPELANGIPAHRLVAAERELTAPVVLIQRGRWTHSGERAMGADALGLLVLEGLIVRRVGHAEGFGAELLGPGDLLRTDRHPGEDSTPGFVTTLSVIQSGRVAVLDGLFCERLGDHPTVASNLVRRAMAQSHALTVSMAVAHYPRVERRVHAMLWLLAQRWGRVSSEGVCLRVPLTHAILADLIAARRPSVTLALAQLERGGLLLRRQTDWILLGPPPESAPVAPLDGPRWTTP